MSHCTTITAIVIFFKSSIFINHITTAVFVARDNNDKEMDSLGFTSYSKVAYLIAAGVNLYSYASSDGIPSDSSDRQRM